MERLLMSRDTLLAKIDPLGHFTVENEKLLPLYFQRTQDLNGWLVSRAIDTHRPNSRLLKKALRLAERDDISTALTVNAVTVTDTYWVKETGSDLVWDDVRRSAAMYAHRN